MQQHISALKDLIDIHPLSLRDRESLTASLKAVVDELNTREKEIERLKKLEESLSKQIEGLEDGVD
jgi:cell division protein FtsB